MEGISPNVGVFCSFIGLDRPDKEPTTDVELPNPPDKKLESILTGDDGLNDLALSPSVTICIDLSTLV